MDGDAGEPAGAELLLEILGERRHLAAALHGRDGDGMLVNLPRLGVPAVRRAASAGGEGGGDEARAVAAIRARRMEELPKKRAENGAISGPVKLWLFPAVR